MFYNDYSLHQLLELALRVPEVGAVNFNILYYILKSIIQQQGLEDVKPVFSLDAPLNVPSNETKPIVKGGSLRRSYSAESLQSIHADKVLKQTESDESSSKAQKSTKVPISTEKDKWQKTLLFKRLDAVEDEISELHIMIAQLVDKISNFERVTGLQETKFMKHISELHHLINTKEDPSLIKKLDELSSKVENSMKIEAERKEDESDEMIFEEDFESELDVTRRDESKSCELQDKIKIDDVKLEVTELEEAKLEEMKPSETKLKEMELDKLKEGELEETRLEEMPSISDETKSDTMKEDTKKSKKSTRHRVRDQELVEKIDDLNEEIQLIKKQLKMESSRKITHENAEESTHIKKEVKEVVEKESVTKADVLKIDHELVNVLSEVHKTMERCAAMDKAFSSDINHVKEKNLILEKTLEKHGEDLEELKINWDEIVHGFESVKEKLQYIENEMTVLLEFSGLKNRVERLEEYVYSEYDAGLYPRSSETSAEDMLITEAETKTESFKSPKDITLFKPSVKKAEKAKAHSIQEILGEDETFERGVSGKFLAVSRDVTLIQDMQRKRRTPKLKMKDLYDAFEDEDDFFTEESDFEIADKVTVIYILE